MNQSRYARQYSEESEIGDTPALDLTFGVEIECLLLQDLQSEPFDSYDPYHRIDHGRQVMHEALSRPMLAMCAVCQVSHTFHLPLNSITDRLIHDSNPARYQKWSVITDATVELTDEQTQSLPSPSESTSAHAIEIVSRVMKPGHNLSTVPSNQRANHVHEITFQEEVRAVFTALQQHFNVPTAKRSNAYRLMVNEKTGLHVHVGNGRKSFPLPTIKNLTSAYVAFEREIDGMQARSRIDGRTLLLDTETATPLAASKLTTELSRLTSEESEESEYDYYETLLQCNAYNIPWSAHFVTLERAVRTNDWSNFRHHATPQAEQYPRLLLKKNKELREAAVSNDLPSRMKLIDGAENMGHLKHLHGSASPISTMKLDNLVTFDPEGYEMDDERVKGKKLTVEFRQHAGTLDAGEALAWISFLLHLVNYAHNSKKDDVKATCLKSWNNPTIKMHKALGFHNKHYQLVAGGPQTWADIYRKRNTALAEAFPESDRLRQVWLHCIRDCADDREPDRVRERIREKLVAVCYGQFNGKAIDGLSKAGFELNDEEKMRLVMGTETIGILGTVRQPEPIDEEPGAYGEDMEWSSD